MHIIYCFFLSLFLRFLAKMAETKSTSFNKVALGCAPYVPRGTVIPHNANTGSYVYILPSGGILAYINLNVDDRTGEVKYCVVFPDSKPEGIAITILKQFNLVTVLPFGKIGEKTQFKLLVSIAGVKPIGTIGDHFRSLTAPYIGFAIDMQNGFTIQEKSISIVMKNRKHEKSNMVQEFFKILFEEIYTESISVPELKVKSFPKVVELQVSSNSFPVLSGQKTVVSETPAPVIATHEPATSVPATHEPATSVPATHEPATSVPATHVPVTSVPALPCIESSSDLSDDDIFAYKYRLLELEMSKLSAEHFLKKLKVSLNVDMSDDEKDSYDEQILGFTRDLVTFKREQRHITKILTDAM